MELDELKNVWTVLDEQLKKNEMLNKQILSEMIYKKSTKSLNWLLNMDFWSIPILLSTIPLCVWLYSFPNTRNNLLPKLFLAFSILTCILGVVWYSYKILKYLIRIDFFKSIKDNMNFVNKYAILIKREKNVSFCIVLPIYSILGILLYYEFNATASLWVFLITSLMISAFITYWLYKKIYDKNIQSIKKSLEELNELKEE